MPCCVTKNPSAKTSNAAPRSSLDSRAVILDSSSLKEETLYKSRATNSAVRGCLGTIFFMMECKCIFLYTVQLIFGGCLLNFRALCLSTGDLGLDDLTGEISAGGVATVR